MHVTESIVLELLGLALVIGVPALLYFLLPQAVLDTATRHGRYAGLGLQPPMIGLPQRVASVDSLAGQRA